MKIDTIDAVRLMLFESKKYGDGLLSETEISALSLITKKETNGRLFDDAYFSYGYGIIFSPKIRRTLEDFYKSIGSKIIEKRGRIFSPDKYYFITTHGIERAEEYMPKNLSPGKNKKDVEQMFNIIKERLSKDRKDMVKEAFLILDKEMRKRSQFR